MYRDIKNCPPMNTQRDLANLNVNILLKVGFVNSRPSASITIQGHLCLHQQPELLVHSACHSDLISPCAHTMNAMESASLGQLACTITLLILVILYPQQGHLSLLNTSLQETTRSSKQGRFFFCGRHDAWNNTSTCKIAQLKVAGFSC